MAGRGEVYGPSAVRYDESHPMPQALTREGMKRVVKGFADAARRAVKAGFDVVEIHGAHGFLISSFLSPTSNKRADEYGGSFLRIGPDRLAVEVVDLVRAVIPPTMPLFFRYASASPCGGGLSCSELTYKPQRVGDRVARGNVARRAVVAYG